MHPKLLESTVQRCREYIEAGDCHGEPPPVERLIEAVVQLSDNLTDGVAPSDELGFQRRNAATGIGLWLHMVKCDSPEDTEVLKSFLRDVQKLLTAHGVPEVAPAQPIQQQTNRAVELLAEDIYNDWSDLPGWVPWVAGGNSMKQDEARQHARASLGVPSDTVQVPKELLREARDNCEASIAETGISIHRKEYRIDLHKRLKAALTDGVTACLPRSDSEEAADGIEAVMAERNYPCAPKNAARVGWEAAFRWLRSHGVQEALIVQCPGCGEGIAEGMPCRSKRGHPRPPNCCITTERVASGVGDTDAT